MATFVPYDRVIVLALDSLCWEVLLPLVKEGVMPALESYLKNANFGVLESSIPPHTAAAWTTFLTGKDPGQHGVIDFVKFDPAEYKFAFHTSAGHKSSNILARLTKAGISCGSLFLPRNYPPYPLHSGYVISGFETPDHHAHFAEPAELREEVLGVSPQLSFDLAHAWEKGQSEEAFERNIELSINAVDHLERLTIHFQRERPTRLQIAYLQATDVLFHKAWKWCQPGSGPGHEARWRLVKKFFRRVDALINRAFGLHSASSSQRFRSGGQPRTLRVICSDHGHGSSEGRIYINSLLAEWGFQAQLSGLREASWRLSMLMQDAKTRRARGKEVPVNWKRTKAYLAHVGIYGFVYVNLQGREKQGIVPPEQFESVRNALIEKFTAERIPGTDKPLFPKVLKGEEVYARKAELGLPDLVVVPADGFLPRIKHRRRGAIRVTPNGIGGVHRTDGIYAFEGPDIAPSLGFGRRSNIADIAPTLLAALGQQVPASMSGTPMLHAFSTPPTIIRCADEAPAEAPAAQSVYSAAEEKAIETRLADLGYLE